MSTAAYPVAPSVVHLPECPYVGLESYSEEQSGWFFGRDRDREVIAANLRVSRLTVLYGASGVGKSSVLRAGVAYDLRGEALRRLAEPDVPHFAIVVFSSWRDDDPVAALVEESRKSIEWLLGGSANGSGSPCTSLSDALMTECDRVGGKLLIVLDQFEEYFLYHGDEEGAGTFAAEFARAANHADLRVNFLISIREDALAKLDRFQGRIPHLFDNYLRIDHLDLAAAREAIERPVAAYSSLAIALGEAPVELEPTLVSAVLHELSSEPTEAGSSLNGDGKPGEPAAALKQDRIEAPYLQLVMTRLWNEERANGSPVLRLATLERLGGANEIVQTHLDEAMRALEPEERDVAARAFRHLVTPSGTKIALTVNDLAYLAEWDEALREAQLRPVLEKLSNPQLRILRSVDPPSDQPASPRYQIFHDVLAEPVLAWSAAHRADEKLERARRRQRRLAALAAAALVGLAAMALVTVFALTQRSEARSQATRAQSRALAANAATRLDVDPELSMLLALEAARLERTPEVEDVLRRSVIASRVRELLPSGGGAMLDAEFSPDGKSVVTGDRSGLAQILDRSTGRVYKLLHDRSVRDVAFSPDDALVVTASGDGTAGVWNAKTGERLATLRHGAAVTSASFSPDGSLVVTSSRDGTVRVWRTADGVPVWVLANLGQVSQATFAARADMIVAVSGVKALILRASDGVLVRALDDQKEIKAAAVTPDGRLVLTAGEDYDAHIWDTKTGRVVHTLVGHSGSLNDAAFSADGSLAVTASEDGSGRVWDVASGALVAILTGHKGHARSASFNAEGTRVVTTSDDLTARVWDVADGRLLATLLGHTEPLVTASFSQDGLSVVTAAKDGTARLWDPNVEPPLAIVSRFPSDANVGSFGRRGELLASGGEDRLARVVDTRTGEELQSFHHDGPVTGVQLSADGTLLVTSTEDGSARLWNVSTGALLRTFDHGAPVEAAAIAPGGRRVVTVGDDGVTRLWIVTTGASKRLPRSYPGPVTAAAFSPDGSLVATGGSDGSAEIRDAATGVRFHKLRGHEAKVAGLAFSPDGSLLVTTSEDNNGVLWDVHTGKRLHVLRAHFGLVRGADFSPDGRWIVTTGPITAGLWQVDGGRFLFYLRGHKGLLLATAFARNGRIVTAGKDGTIRAYDCDVCGTLDELIGLTGSRLARTGRTLTPAERAQYLER